MSIIGKSVTVNGGDYEYSGVVTAVFLKRRGHKLRVVVEDASGRCFIHNLGQTDVPLGDYAGIEAFARVLAALGSPEAGR